MTRIYLVRHAEAEGNLYRIVQGQGNSNLTDRGWQQVAALERRFADIHIDALYTSDLYRTCATASAIYKPKGLTPIRRKDLREIYVGDWEGRTWGDIVRRWPEQMACFSRRPHLWRIEGAELPLEVLARIREAVFSIARENEGKTVAIVSHGYAIRLLLAQLQGYPADRLGESPTGQNTAVSLLELEGDTVTVLFRDDTSHLQTAEYLSKMKEQRKSDPLEPGLWFTPAAGEDAAALAAACGLTLLPHRHTLIGWSRETPVGVVQLGDGVGEVALVCILPDYRNKSFGGQLIGQAVQWTRSQGGEALYADLSGWETAVSFFRDYGFRPESAGSRLFVKDIRFLPEYLSES